LSTESEVSVEFATPPASPYEGTRIGIFDHLKLSSYWFGSNFAWGCFLGPVLSSEMERLAPSTSAGSLGLLYFFGALPAIFVPLIFGPLSDRCQSPSGRRKPYILGGAIIALVGIAVMATAYQGLALIPYIGGYLVLQIGSNIALAAYSGIIPDLVPPEQRGIASGYMAVMSQVATLLGVLIGGSMVDKGLNTWLYLIIAGVFSMLVAVAYFGIRESPLTGLLPPFSLPTYLKRLWIDPRKYPDFAWVWFTRALMMLGFYAIQPYILYFLRDVIGVKNPAMAAGALGGIILLGAAVSGFVGGRISDHTGRKPVVIASSYIIAVAAVSLIFARNLEVALAIGVFFGLGYGAYISVDWALGADVLPNRADAGKDMAVWHVAMTLPQQLAPLISGYVLQAFMVGKIVQDSEEVAKYGLGGYAVIFTFSALCFLLGGYLLRKVKGVK